MMHTSLRKNLLTSLVKGGVLCLTAIGVIFAARFFELGSLQESGWIESHLRQGGRGVVTFMAIAAVCSAVGVPRQVLAFLGGYAFGAVHGIAWTSLGLAAGCACGLFYSRLLGQKMVLKRFGPRIRTVNSFLCSSPFLTAIMIRFFPVGNNALVNLTAGVTAIPALPFIAGSAIGYLPQTIVFALLGSGIQLEATVQILLSSFLFIITSLLGVYLWHKFKARDTAQTPVAPSAGKP